MFLRPSSSAMWTRCGAQPHLASRPDVQPRPETDAAMEGTAAAWVAETVINGDATTALDMLGETAPNGWSVDEDMVRHIQNYLDIIDAARFDHAVAEVKLHLVPDLCAGTADLVAIRGDDLFLIDLKYGFDIVEAFENTQLICYGAAAFGTSGFKRVHLGVYQPRAPHAQGPMRWWTLNADQMRAWSDWIIGHVHAVQTDRTATPGAHCAHCPAAASCEALKRSVYGLHPIVQHTALHHLTPAELAQELDIIDHMEGLLKARATATRAQAEELIRGGGFVPGWAMETRTGRRVLRDDMLDTLAAMTGHDPYERVLKTPAALEREGLPAAVVNAYSRSTETGWKLSRVKGNTFDRFFKGPPK